MFMEDKVTSILTFYNAENYGAVLQTLALQEALSNVNQINKAYVIELKPSLKHFVSKKMKIKLPFFWRIPALFRFSKSLLMSKKIWTSIKEKINLISWENAKKGGCIIVGSDQIWNPNFVFEREDYFFLNLGKSAVQKISYAASIGVREWPDWFKFKALPLLKEFNAISVRENSAKEYLSSLGLQNVVVVCDPTILLPKEYYISTFQLSLQKRDAAFVYKIRETIPSSLAKFVAKSIMIDLSLQKRNPSVSEWLNNILNSSFVVTDSFHCTVFCLLFHKKFIVISNNSSQKGMNERFATLLGKTHLEYRCLSCDESSEEVEKILNTSIEWKQVDVVLNEWRTKSLNWLKEVLVKT